MATAGRRPGPTETPDTILRAARAMFADGGFQGTSVRAIAKRAGVNAALVHHYFGSKQDLFVTALDLPINPVQIIDQLLAAGPREDFPERFVRFFVTTWREPSTGQPLQAMLRRAASTEEGAATVRAAVENILLEHASAVLGVSRLRVAAALSHLIGIALGATVIRIDTLTSASTEELVDLLAPSIARYVNHDGGSASSSAARRRRRNPE